MKKLFTALALSSIISTTASAQRHQTDRENDSLMGPVKSVSVETAILNKQGERYVEEARVIAERVTYNAEGNRVYDEWYLDRDTLIKKTMYRYVGGEKLADAQVSSPVITIPDRSIRVGGGMRPVSEKYKYKYDDKGRVREMIIEEDGRVRIKATYKHQSGRKETRSYDGGGDTLSYRRVDTFDARGNLIESTEFDPVAGDVVSKHIYTGYEFDARGNWVRRLKSETSPGEPELRRMEYRTVTYF